MKIIFVCYGNICRSPMAEALMRRTIEARPALRGVEVESMGVQALAGRAATEHTIDVLRDHYALDLGDHRASRLEPPVQADLILALDRLTTGMVEAMRLSAEVSMLGDYAGTGEEVVDPYGRDREVYDACAGHVAALVELAADRLESAARSQTGQGARRE
jgi:protein-tyrosine phosphatase